MRRFIWHSFMVSPSAGSYHLIHWLLFPGMNRAIRCVVERAKGRIVDLGCGMGIYALNIAERRKDLAVLGIDMQAVRCEQAMNVARRMGVQNALFKQANLFDIQEKDVAMFLLCDVLLYYPQEEQNRYVESLVARLIPTGSLILKDHAPVHSWQRELLRLEERLGRAMRYMLGTESDSSYHGKRIHPVSLNERVDFLESLGLAVEVIPVHQASLLPHVLLVATKQAKGV